MSGLSSVPLQLAPAPVRLFSLRVELRDVVSVRCAHDADPGEHRGAAAVRYQDTIAPATSAKVNCRDDIRAERARGSCRPGAIEHRLYLPAVQHSFDGLFRGARLLINTDKLPFNGVRRNMVGVAALHHLGAL